MKNYFGIDCKTVLDSIYKTEENSPSFLTQIRTDLHLLLCTSCTYELSILQKVDEILKTDFFPLAPDFEASVMESLSLETVPEKEIDAPAGFSLRFWVIAGFFILFSLSTSFFGLNFIHIANEEGLSFLIPVGITIGLVVTCYGAFFIGSHLKELSDRFGIH